MRYLIRLLVLGLPISLASLSGCVNEELVLTDSGRKPEPTPTVTPTPAPTPFTLTGTGSVATEPFSLAGGPTIFHLVSKDRYFGSLVYGQVTLMRADGSSYRSVVLDYLSFNGAKLVGVDKGSYWLNVKTTEPWSITIEQPRTASAVKFDRLSGSMDVIYGPFIFPSSPRLLSTSHDATDDFSVYYIKPDGSQGDYYYGARGLTSDSAITSGHAGIMFVGIHSKGSWTLEEAEQ